MPLLRELSTGAEEELRDEVGQGGRNEARSLKASELLSEAHPPVDGKGKDLNSRMTEVRTSDGVAPLLEGVRVLGCSPASWTHPRSS